MVTKEKYSNRLLNDIWYDKVAALLTFQVLEILPSPFKMFLNFQDYLVI